MRDKGVIINSVLDNIKAEIFNACSDNYHMPVHTLSCDEIFEIINKYMAQRNNMEFSYKLINPFQDGGLSDEDRLLIDSIRKAAYICGHRSDDIEYTVYQVLKQIGRTDLLPSCERSGSE